MLIRKLVFFAAMATLGGCDTTNTNNYFFADMATTQTGGSDGSSLGQACKPNTQDCVNDSLARVCPSDGSGWLAVQCAFGEICQAGNCVFDQQGTSCLPSDSFCTGDTTALVCNDNGVGFMMLTCPANTNCVGTGQCAGNCLVGQSMCLDANTVAVCADGQTFTSAACPSGQLCASDGNGGGSCLPNTCTPDTVNGCNAACGNKVADPASTDPGFVSFCEETPQGWRWQATNCLAPAACDPQGFDCDTGPGAQAGCDTQCTPGSTVCSPSGTGVQTCDPTTGKLAAPVACNAALGQVCIQLNITGAAMCGDPICGFAPGACTDTGFRACDGNGKLSPSSAPCTTGRCIPSGQTANGLQAGQCGVDCQTSDAQCVPDLANPGSNLPAFQSCVNGVWGPPTQCAVASGCFNFFTDPPASRPRAVCGDCAPGTHQCTDGAGTVQPEGSSDFVQACDATGHFSGTPTHCVATHCDFSDPLFDDACVANCVPGKVTCGTTPATSPAPLNFGTRDFSTCTVDGNFGTPSNCATGRSCRSNSAGVSLGCLVCVPADNETGQTDTRCSTFPGGTAPGTTAVQTCNATGTAWLAPVSCGGLTCADPSPAPSFPLNTGPYCHQCQNPDAASFNEFPQCGDLNLDISLEDQAGIPSGCSFTLTEAGVSWNEGAPIPCAGDSSGQSQMTDCCANDCYADPPPPPRRVSVAGAHLRVAGAGSGAPVRRALDVVEQDAGRAGAMIEQHQANLVTVD